MRLRKLATALGVLAVAAGHANASPTAVHRAGLHDVRLTARDLLSLKDIGGAFGIVSVSPDERSVAFEIQQPDFRADTYRSEWYIARTDGRGMPVDVGSGGDVMLEPAPFGRVDGARADVRAQWSPDGRWVAFLRKDGGQIQVWRSRTDGGGEEQVTHSGANVLSFAWRPDGRAIYFEVGRSRKAMARRDRLEGERGYLLDDRFFPDYSTKPLWFACGARIWNIPAVASERCEPQLRVATFAPPAERNATAAEAREYARLISPARPPGIAVGRSLHGIAWNAAHTRAAWLENLHPKAEPGFAAPLTLFVAGRRCRAPQCTGRLVGVWWSGSEVVFQRREGWDDSVQALYTWIPGSSAPRLIYRKDSTLRSCAMAAGRLLCLQETPIQPRRIISIDLASGRVRAIFDPNPGFARFRLGKVEKLEVTDGFGNKAFGHLVYPPNFRPGHRYPLVIVQYRSRGFLRGGTGNEFPIFPLAAAGFLVYSSDSPGDQRLLEEYDATQWQGLAAQLTREVGPSGYRMRSALGALNAVIETLDRRGILDPAKVGITGLSAGAEVLYYAITHSKRFAAAAVSGMESPASYLLEVNRTMQSLLEAEWGTRTLEEATQVARRIQSLAYNARVVDTPLLIQVADRELIDTLPGFVALRAAGKPVEAYVFPDEYHIKFHPLHKLAAGERAIDWFRFWLENQEDPAPAKATQYARWRSLRAKMQARHSSRKVMRRYPCPRTPCSRPDLRRDTCRERG